MINTSLATYSIAGWGSFVQLCASKAEKRKEAGGTVVKVPPHHTSQVCHRCGTMVPKDLSMRWHSCPECGEELDRDHNSALEVLHRYQRTQKPLCPPHGRLAGAGSVPQEPVASCGEARLLSKPPE